MHSKIKFIYCICITILIICGVVFIQKNQNIVSTSSNVASNTNQEALNNDTKKMSWGIKRNSNHEQPDVGSENKKILEENKRICLGESLEKNIYLTFDCGYEAGYTEKILDVLKENDVKATFFITSHYLNTASEIVERMINEGHIVGNHTPNFLMSRSIV